MASLAGLMICQHAVAVPFSVGLAEVVAGSSMHRIKPQSSFPRLAMDQSGLGEARPHATQGSGLHLNAPTPGSGKAFV